MEPRVPATSGNYADVPPAELLGRWDPAFFAKEPVPQQKGETAEEKAARLEGRILFVEITPQQPILDLVEEDYMMYTDLVSAERRRLCDVATAYVSGEANARERFAAANTMTTGQPADAAFGINRYLGLSDKEIWGKMALGLERHLSSSVERRTIRRPRVESARRARSPDCADKASRALTP